LAPSGNFWRFLALLTVPYEGSVRGKGLRGQDLNLRPSGYEPDGFTSERKQKSGLLHVWCAVLFGLGSVDSSLRGFAALIVFRLANYVRDQTEEAFAIAMWGRSSGRLWKREGLSIVRRDPTSIRWLNQGD
jgi:hypothetical protein